MVLKCFNDILACCLRIYYNTDILFRDVHGGKEICHGNGIIYGTVKPIYLCELVLTRMSMWQAKSFIYLVDADDEGEQLSR